MTKSEMFKKAHKIARETKEIAGSYRIAFACALKDIHSGLYSEKTVEEKLVEIGASIWENYGYKRIYLNEEIVLGMGFKKVSSGKWIKGEDCITSCDMKSIIARAYYDCDEESWNFSKCTGSCLFSEHKAIFASAI